MGTDVFLAQYAYIVMRLGPSHAAPPPITLSCLLSPPPPSDFLRALRVKFGS